MVSPAIAHILRYKPPAAAAGGFEAPAYVTTTSRIDLANVGTTYTFSAISIGTADANRQVIIGITQYGTSDPSSVTIGGVTATQVTANTRTSNMWSAIYIANVPTGTTADIVITVANNSGTYCRVSVYRMVKSSQTAASTGTPVNAAFANAVITITVPSGGTAIWSGHNDNSFGGGDVGWTGTSVTDDFSTGEHAAASSTTSGSKTGTLASGGGGSERVGAVAAAWGP